MRSESILGATRSSGILTVALVPFDPRHRWIAGFDSMCAIDEWPIGEGVVLDVVGTTNWRRPPVV